MYGPKAFEIFSCPSSMHPLVFAQMCSFYHQGKLQDQISSIQTQSLASNSTIAMNTSEVNTEVTQKAPKVDSGNALGQVWVGNPHKAICIPTNSMKVLQGQTSRVTCRISCMIEPRATNNLPMGLVVNRTMVTPRRSKKVPVTLVNTNSYNVWIWQTLLATDIVEVEHCPWDYQSIMFCDGDNVKVGFCPVPTLEVQNQILTAGIEAKADDKPDLTQKETGKKPKFGPQPGATCFSS